MLSGFPLFSTHGFCKEFGEEPECNIPCLVNAVESHSESFRDHASVGAAMRMGPLAALRRSPPGDYAHHMA